jgi:transketolase
VTLVAARTMREAAAETIVDLFRTDGRVAVVLADISLDLFAEALELDGDRAVNVGIMEQTAVGVAAGFALEGFRPVVHTIAPFVAERSLEQVKLDFGYQGLEGLFVTIGASYDYGESGMTHHSPGDVRALSTVPGIEILVPGAAEEAAQLVRRSYANGRLTYLRTSVAANERPRALEAGGLTLVRAGRDVTVIAAGPFLDRTLEAVAGYSTVTVLARLRGWSTFNPRRRAMR